MTHEEAFLEAILDSPDDDSPRLIFADWLEDHDQSARGELIRLQCRLAGDVDWVERQNLLRREKDLIEANKSAWLGALAERAYEVSFHRGMARVRLQTARFLSARGQMECARHFAPGFVLELYLEGTTSRREQLLSSPLLSRVYRLVLDDPQLDEDYVLQLADCRLLHRLTSLGLRGSVGTASSKRLGERALRALGASPHLRSLTALDFTLHPLTAAALDCLSRECHWPGLSRLDLGWTAVTGTPLLNLLAAPWLDKLTWLGLYSCLSKEEDALSLVCSPRLANLRHLDLGSNNVGDVVAEAIARAGHLAELRRSSLRFSRLTEVGARALAESPYLHKLHYLDLYYLSEEDARTKILRQRFGPALRVDYTRPM